MLLGKKLFSLVNLLSSAPNWTGVYLPAPMPSVVFLRRFKQHWKIEIEKTKCTERIGKYSKHFPNIPRKKERAISSPNLAIKFAIAAWTPRHYRPTFNLVEQIYGGNFHTDGIVAWAREFAYRYCRPKILPHRRLRITVKTVKPSSDAGIPFARWKIYVRSENGLESSLPRESHYARYDKGRLRSARHRFLRWCIILGEPALRDRKWGWIITWVITATGSAPRRNRKHTKRYLFDVSNFTFWKGPIL